jgi:hypothetical protein
MAGALMITRPQTISLQMAMTTIIINTINHITIT